MNRIMNKIRIGIIGVSSVCLGVSAASLYLISPPTIVSASSCTAKCDDGGSVVCDQGTACSANDGVGCTYVKDGETYTKSCS
jgi:hypothetical protein